MTTYSEEGHNLLMEAVEKVGKRFKARFDKQREMTEDLTFDNNTGLYDSAVMGIVSRALRPKLIQFRVMRPIVLDDVQGISTVTVPRFTTILIATAVGDAGAKQSEIDADYETSTAVNIAPAEAHRDITIRLQRQSVIDIVQDQMFEIGDALARYQDDLILAALDTASPADEINYNALGGTTDISWDVIETATKDMRNLNAQPDLVLTNPDNGLILEQSIDVVEKQTMLIGGMLREIPVVHGLGLVIHPTVAANTTYIIDTQNAGYLIFDRPEFMAMRKSTTLVDEIIGVQNSGAIVTNYNAVYRILDNTAP